MEHFTALGDVSDPIGLLAKAKEAFQHPHNQPNLGEHKTLGLIFLNPSLRTRMSTDIAAKNLGMRVIVMNINRDGWRLEFEDGAVMDGQKAEHIKDAARVLGEYVDILGVRTFAGLQDREADYQERLLNAFKQYAGVPIISLESATRHPLQSLADWMTIDQFAPKSRPKVVLSWAPHPKALPQAVANSFVEWMQMAPVDLVVTHPEGYDLSPDFVKSVPTIYRQEEALVDADFVYVKSWASYTHYGERIPVGQDWQVTPQKMALTAEAKFMHCLPVRRNIVAADAVLDSPNSLIIPQAGNRIPAAQAVIAHLLKDLA